MLIKRWYLFFVSLFFLSTSLSAFAELPNGIVAFGDSLSDNGNISDRIGKYIIPKFIFTIPNKKHYYEGRFSNGPVWVETLADVLNLPLENKAMGSAEVYENTVRVPILYPSGLSLSLTNQVSGYISDEYGYVDPNKLYVIWIGGNDYVRSYADNPQYLVQGVITAMQTLYNAGARDFLVMNLPDLSLAPIVTENGTNWDRSALSNIVTEHNAELARQVAEFKKQRTDAHLDLYDVDALFNELIQDPAKYGFTDVTTRCYEGGIVFSGGDHIHVGGGDDFNDGDDPFSSGSLNSVGVLDSASQSKLAAVAQEISLSQSMSYRNYTCPTPDTYVFWDGMHPTTKVHSLFAARIADMLKASY